MSCKVFGVDTWQIRQTLSKGLRLNDCNRNRVSPIPKNLREVPSDLQLLALRRIEGFGWDLRFVRAQNSENPIPVVSDASGKTIGILEDDGRVNLQHNLQIRP